MAPRNDRTEGPTHRRRKGRPVPRPSSDRRIVPLDTSAIRDDALRAYHREEKGVARLRRELETFRNRDVPGFRAWMHARFGAELTQQRELSEAIESKRKLLLEVEDVAIRFGLSDEAAYSKVLWRRAHPEEADAEDRAMDEQARREREAARDDDDGLFDDVGGEEPDDDDDAWDDSDDSDEFDAIFEEMGGFRMPHRHTREQHKGASDLSLKTAYRTIVRRLHPDRSGSFTEAEKQLWDEAQEAYKRGDLHALQGVLAHCEGGSAGIGRHSAVSLIRRLIRECRTKAHALRGELRKARREHAWGFAQRGQTPSLARKVQLLLEADRRQLAWLLEDVNRAISALERAAATRAGRRQKRQRPPSLDLFDLPF